MYTPAYSNSADSIHALSNLDWKQLTADQLEQFPRKRFKKNSYVYLPDNQANQIFLVKSGRVKVGSHHDWGKEIIKKIALPGDIFGEFSLIGQEIRRDYALATEDTEVYMLTIADMLQIMRSHPKMGFLMMQLLGARLIETEQRLESLVFKSSRSRIIEFLKNLVKKRGQRVGYEMLVRQFMTHQEIANLTATSRQTVTTVLNDLRNKNILTFNRRRLLVRDMALLSAEIA